VGGLRERAMAGFLDKKPAFRIAGDRGLLVEYGDAVDPVVNRKVRSVAAALDREPLEGVVEYVPAYRSLLLVYDPLRTDPSTLEKEMRSLEGRLAGIETPPAGTVQIPVCYGGEFGPDISIVAESHNMTVDEVVRIHSRPDYQVYMIGFTPGFPFLGGLDERLHTPRRETPRTLVPAGSVGIANAQTGVYPVDSPGGWRLIGRTPLKLFDPEREEPFLVRAGDVLRFQPVTRSEYFRLAGEGGA